MRRAGCVVTAVDIDTMTLGGLGTTEGFGVQRTTRMGTDFSLVHEILNLMLLQTARSKTSQGGNCAASMIASSFSSAASVVSLRDCDGAQLPQAGWHKLAFDGRREARDLPMSLRPPLPRSSDSCRLSAVIPLKKGAIFLASVFRRNDVIVKGGTKPPSHHSATTQPSAKGVAASSHQAKGVASLTCC